MSTVFISKLLNISRQTHTVNLGIQEMKKLPYLKVKR